MNSSTCSGHSNISSSNNSVALCSCACHKKRQQHGEPMPSTANNNNSAADTPETGTILATVGEAVAPTSLSAAIPAAARRSMSPRGAAVAGAQLTTAAAAKRRTAPAPTTPAFASSSRSGVRLRPRRASNASSARNLIAETIKDVSETIKCDTAGSDQPRTAGRGVGASAGDFPTSISVVGTASSRGCNRNRSTANSADASKTAAAARTTATTAGTTTAKGASPVSQLTKMKKITRETTHTTTTNMAKAATVIAATVSTTTTTKAQKKPISAATRTQSRFVPNAMAAPQAQATTAVAQKSKLTENKCPLEALTNVSSQGKVEVTISQSRAHSGSTTAQQRNKWIKAPSKQSAQHDRLATGSRATKDIKRISSCLAERKAKLKADFFGDTASQAVTPDISVAERSPASVDDIKTVAKLKGSSRKADAFKRFLSRTQTPSQRCRPTRCDKVGSTSTAIVEPPLSVLAPVTVNVFAAEPQPESEPEPVSSPSLVTQRKLDLKRKFEQQSNNSTKTSPAQRSTHLSSSSRVERLVQKFDIKPHRTMIVNVNKVPDTDDVNMLSLKPDTMEQRNSPLSDEGCNLGQSPYSSDNEDNESIRTTSTTVERCKHKDKVARSASSDSALGLDVDESMDTAPALQPTGSTQRRMTLTVTDLPLRPALLPLAEPTALPDSPTMEVHNTQTQAAVPSKVLLEERVVELPEDPRSVGCSVSSSRRESAQSSGSDFLATECPGGRRFVRTPSVVVSDYSDDVMCGITLEEIEYFRAQRMRRRYSSLDTATEADGQSDVSASSSCSNLYYCGSTISALDGAECYVNGMRTALGRKISDCSTGSASADEDGFTIPEDSGHMSSDLADLLAAQHLSSKQPKKVGLVVPRYGATGEKTKF